MRIPWYHTPSCMRVFQHLSALLLVSVHEHQWPACLQAQERSIGNSGGWEQKLLCITSLKSYIFSDTDSNKKVCTKPKTISPSFNACINSFLFIIFTLDFYIMVLQASPIPRINRSESHDCTKWSWYCYFTEVTLHISTLSTSTDGKCLSHTCFSILPLTSAVFWLTCAQHF